MKALEALCEYKEVRSADKGTQSRPSSAKSLKRAGTEPSIVTQLDEESEEEDDEDKRGAKTSFAVVRVVNGFDPNECKKMFPQTAGILLICAVGARPAGAKAVWLRQLVEVELVFDRVKQARWLAEYLNLTPDLLQPDPDSARGRKSRTLGSLPPAAVSTL